MPAKHARVRMPEPIGPVVLVVDDEPAVRAVLVAMLRCLGYVTLTAGGGTQAVEMCQRHENIAVVVMDVQMPEMDGPATLHLLRSLYPQIRCAFLSGHTGTYTDRDLLDLGATAVLTKPVGMNQLNLMLTQVLAPPLV